MARSEKQKIKENNVRLTFTKNYNYSSGYIIGKFKTYLYDTEEKFKLDHAGKHELLRGQIKDHLTVFSDFMKTIKAHYPDSIKLATELNRIGASAAEAHQKMISGGTDGWFRITFSEEKYVKGIVK